MKALIAIALCVPLAACERVESKQEVTNGLRAAWYSEHPIGRFQTVRAVVDGAPIMYVLDTATGRVRACYLVPNPIDEGVTSCTNPSVEFPIVDGP